MPASKVLALEAEITTHAPDGPILLSQAKAVKLEFCDALKSTDRTGEEEQ